MSQSDGHRDELYRALPDADAAGQMSFESEGRPDGSDAEDEPWEPAAVHRLLALYLQHRHRFRNPKVRKKNVWTEISSLVNKSPDACDKKFRNLKQTYVRLLKKRQRTGKSTFRWPYFDAFEEIYQNDASLLPEIDSRLLEECGEKPEAVVDVAEGARCPERSRRRAAGMRALASEMRERQLGVESKLDRLIAVVEESNNIQRERNDLFQRFLDHMSHGA